MTAPATITSIFIVFSGKSIMFALSVITCIVFQLAYVFALLPYIVLVALLVQSVLYEGAWEGIVYFLKPRWGEILNARVSFPYEIKIKMQQ